MARADQPTINSATTNRTYYNKTFEDNHDLFMFACAHGDYMLVDRLLSEGEVKADLSNRMGKSALQLAIENEHFEVVRVLLDKIPYEKFRDALLLAIYLGHIEIADFIMNHPVYMTFYGGFRDPIDPQAYDDSQFSSDITPLILAAQYNRLQIVHQLLSRGETIKAPHPNMCPCQDCAESSASDSFRQAQVRLSAYKGLSSEVYIALAYPDPILQAFELGNRLRLLSEVEHYFREDYRKLADQLSLFVTRLLDNVRGHEELEIVLNKTGQPDEEKYENLARFDLAIQYEEKAFVAHSNCQQKLMEKWYENLSSIKNAHLTKRVTFYLTYILCLPVLLLLFFFSPNSKIGSFCNQPNLRLKAYIVSYLTFIGLIVASSYFSVSHLQKTTFLSDYNVELYENYTQYIFGNPRLRQLLEPIQSKRFHSVINCDLSLRFMGPNPFQIAIFIWLIGFVWQEFKQISSSGPKIYFTSKSNYVDCSMNALYIFYFIFLYSSMVLTRTSMNRFGSPDFWKQAASFSTMSKQEQYQFAKQVDGIIYWLNADRFYWTSADLQNLAEAFFAMGNVVSICRICFLLPIIGFVGPLQIMLERMINDILKWLVIMSIFFSAFACSLFMLFSHFAVSLEQRHILIEPMNRSVLIDIDSTTNQSFSIAENSRCPSSFDRLIDRNVLVSTAFQHDLVSDDENETFCGKLSLKDEYLRIGSFPAVHYFGESFGTTILTTFFSLFGVIGTDDMPSRGYELITLACNKPDLKSYRAGFDQFTSNLGFIIYGLFSFVCVTVLINTLIAMMEETIDLIDDRADVEWKYARSKLYMEYIRDGNPLPVPLNICPTPKSIVKFFRNLVNFIRSRNFSRNPTNQDDSSPTTRPSVNRRNNTTSHYGKQSKFKNERIFDRRRSVALTETLTYKIVIERIVKRFLIYYKSNNSGSQQKNDGLKIKQFKNDVSSLRFELLNGIEILEGMHNNLAENIETLNEKLTMNYDLEQIQDFINTHGKEMDIDS